MIDDIDKGYGVCISPLTRLLEAIGQGQPTA